VRRFLQVGLAAVITALMLLYALWGVDFPRLGRLLAGADYTLLLPFEAALVLFFVFTGLRWNLILRSQGRYSLRQSGPAMMIGFAGNNVLPAHLGELVRAVVFARQSSVPAAAVFMTLVVERILDVLAILLFYFLAVALILYFTLAEDDDPVKAHVFLLPLTAAFLLALSVAIFIVGLGLTMPVWPEW